MDPVSAIGVAAAVLQFIDVGLKVLKTCKEIRDDTQSSTLENKELEKGARTLELFRKDLTSSRRTPSSRISRRVDGIAQGCAVTAREIIDLLEYVRGGSQKIGPARATWRAMLKRKPIDELRKRLEAQELVLDKVLTQDTNINVSNLREEMRRQQISTRESVDRLSSRLSNLNLKTVKRIGIAEHNIHRRFDSAARLAQDRYDSAQQQKNHEQFLASLFFPEMSQRQSSIKHAEAGTLEWIYELDKPGDDEEPRPWADLACWFREESSVYWISGKAGSGKSYLMAYIMQDERTKEAMQIWAGAAELHLLSFFFWRPGSELQKSVVGLLRSVLYQICKTLPNTVGAVLHKLGCPIQLLPAWTEKDLITAVKAAIAAAKECRFGLFLDGLDEYTGLYDDLVDMIFELQGCDNIKCCVASRPEIELWHRLAGCRYLRLQDINRSDIQQLVTKKLETLRCSAEERQNMVHEVVERAQGMFLWAAIVTQSLAKDDRSGCDFDVLVKRLERTPVEIDKLFSYMVENLDDLHRESLSFYLTLMKTTESREGMFIRNLSIITAVRIGPDIASYASFAQFCRQTEMQILAQTVGLLDIVHLESEYIREFTAAPRKFLIPELLDDIWSGPVTVEHRKEVTGDLRDLDILRYERAAVHWVHRSAHDFIFPQGGSPSPIKLFTMQDSNMQRILLDGMLRFTIMAPSHHSARAYGNMTAHRLSSLIEYCGRIYKTHTALVNEFMDRLHGVVAQLSIDEVGKLDSLYLSEANHCFWRLCIVYNAPYTLSRMDQLFGEMQHYPTRILLLCESIQFSYLEGPSDEYCRALHGLLQSIPSEIFTCRMGTQHPQSVHRTVIDSKVLRRAGQASTHLYAVSHMACRNKTCVFQDEPAAFTCYFAIANAFFLFQILLSIASYYEIPQSCALEALLSRFSALLEVSGIQLTTSNHMSLRKPRRMVVQMSSSLWLASIRAAVFSRFPISLPVPLEQSEGITIVCIPQLARLAEDVTEVDPVIVQEAPEAILVILSLKTTQRYLRLLSGGRDAPRPLIHVYGKQAELDDLRQSIYDDIWANEQGLDATQQLFALACVREDLANWLYVADMREGEFQHYRLFDL